jgi:four helix bundle protein
MQRFTELRVWQRSHALALDVYCTTATFPKSEQFGIVSQVRRAAVSIASNIAEGAKRQSRREYARFLNVAEGSLAETESLLRLSRDLGFTDDQVAGGLVKEAEDLSRMLQRFRQAVERRVDDRAREQLPDC